MYYHSHIASKDISLLYDQIYIQLERLHNAQHYISYIYEK